MSIATLRDSGARRARVLVVDNEPAVLAMLMRVLERGGYEPVPADGLIAARAVLDRGGCPTAPASTSWTRSAAPIRRCPSCS
jgi:CheY-like chemotaxis protein